MSFEEKHPFYRIRFVSISLLCLISLILLVACRKEPPPPPPPPKVTVSQPVRKTITDYLELAGNTQAFNTVQLVARVAGYLEQVFFQDGQLVKEGQSLFLIQQNTYQDNLRQAEAAISQFKALLEYAEIQLTRYLNLVQQKAASQADVDNWRYQRDTALANLRSAEVQRDLAKLNLSYTDVRAPFDGRIDRRQKYPGSLVGSGENTVLAELNQINPIYVYFNISDSELARLVGEAHWTPNKTRDVKWPVFMAVLDEKEYPHNGQLDFASISLTPTTGTLLMRGVFPNPAGKILPGLYARVRVPLKKKTALLVPEIAVANDQQGSYVLIVNQKDVVERRSLKTGSTMDNLRVIEQGLNGEERVIVNGLLKTAPGRQVTPEQEKAPPPSPSQSPPQKRAKP